MKYLIKTTDNSALETVDYTRVIYDTTDDNVLIQNTIGGGVSSDFAKTADIVFYDKNAGKLIVVDKNTFNASNYPIGNYTPIGVVAIPSSHNVYGDGSCGIMSLVEMSCDTPDTGSTVTDNISFGGVGIDVDTLPDLNRAPYVGTCDTPGDETSIVVGENDRGMFIPSDQFGIRNNSCPHDLNAYYYHNNPSYYAAPSPYLTNGSRNPAYYQTTSPSSEAKTASIITNSSGEDYYPAACCCWRFHTEGTKQGDWYLPACGELGYVCARFKTINDTISLLTTAYGSYVGISVSSNYYWSSSEYSNFARCVYVGNGGVDYAGKSSSLYCRAFCRVFN